MIPWEKNEEIERFWRDVLACGAPHTELFDALKIPRLHKRAMEKLKGKEFCNADLVNLLEHKDMQNIAANKLLKQEPQKHELWAIMWHVPSARTRAAKMLLQDEPEKGDLWYVMISVPSLRKEAARMFLKMDDVTEQEAQSAVEYEPSLAKEVQQRFGAACAPL